MNSQQLSDLIEPDEAQQVDIDPCDPSQAEEPDIETLMTWELEGICEAVDGCIVEPDGICPHGCQSWLLVLGLI